jgi:tRNA (guanine26-N2/guanine27-N2)-dimethyltransferase
LHALYQEGLVTFQTGEAFYRPTSALSRDLGVLAAKVYRQRQGKLVVLDAMSGCGVRSLRYGVEAAADWVWANEANLDVAPILRQNLQKLPQSQWQLTHEHALRLLSHCATQQQYFDLVDLDSFGSPAAFLSAIIPITRLGGLIYVTATDSRTCAGHDPANGLRQFGSYARSHPAAHEQGLRLLMGTLMQQALFHGFTVQPVFSLFRKAIYRVMVRLVKGCHWQEQQFGFLGYCHHCGHYETVDWRSLNRAGCPEDQQPLTLSGPMWLGTLHHAADLAQITTMARSLNWHHCVDLLQVMTDENELPPYFYTLAELGRRGKMDIPNRDRLLGALHKAGHQGVKTHIEAQAIKTDASFQTCLALAKKL